MSKKTDPKVAEAVMLKAGLQPKEAYKSALSKWKCKCLKCKKIVYPQYNTIQQGHGGCRPCSYGKSGLSHRITEKDAKSRLKKQKLQLAGKYKWQNKEDFKIKCLICEKISITNWDTLGKKGRQLGCRTCSRKAASFLQVTEEKHKQLLAEHNLEPFGKYTGNKDIITVKCLLCNKRKPIRRSFLLQRNNKMQGCMTCSGAPVANPKKIAKVMKKAKLQPLVPYPSAHKKWKCKCLKCGETVYPEFHSILSGQGGCVYCAEIGFNHKKPAFFYIVFQKEMNSLKVGIGNPDSKPERISQHIKEDWILLKKYNFSIGRKAFLLETEIIRWIRKDLKLPSHLTKELMKQGGWSETVDAEELDLPTLYKKVDQVIKGL